MKTNEEVEKIIKDEASKVEIKNFSNEILSKVHHEVKPVEPVEEHKKARWLFPTLVLGLSACVIGGLFVYRTVIEQDQYHKLVETKETVFQNQLFALGNVVLSANDNTNLNHPINQKLLNIYYLDSDEEDEDEKDTENDEESTLNKEQYQTIANNVHEYLFTVTAFVENNMDLNWIKNEDELYKEYEYKAVASYKDSTDDSYVYIAYVNLNKIKDNEVGLDGIVSIKDYEYKLTGKQVTKYTEAETTLTIETGKDTKVSIENETEVNENEYNYKFYKNNEIYKEVNMEFEVEDGRKESEIEIVENENTISYEFEYVSDNTIECEYFNNSVGETEMIITIEENKYIYDFGDSIIIEIDLIKN